MLVLSSGILHARPVSYPGGWTLMTVNDSLKSSAHVHYSPSAKSSIGYRLEYLRNHKLLFHSAQYNYLIKRWNKTNSQANVYVKSSLGLRHNFYSNKNSNNNTKSSMSIDGFVGISGDFEDRRYFVSYENRYYLTPVLENYSFHSARLGFAPYIGDYGDLHTWTMVQFDYMVVASEFIITPLLRFFKGVHLFEIGINLSKGFLLNYIFRF